MQAQYGSYLFPANSLWPTVSRDYELNEAEIPYIEKIEVTLEGFLTGTTQAELTAKEEILIDAVQAPFYDFVFKRDDGGRSGIYLRNGTSLSGVRCIKGPNFGEKVGAEYANQRKYTVTFGASYPILNLDTRYISFKERMAYSGGEPVFDYKNAINGEPQLQQVWFREPYQLVQSGEAFGFADYPPYPPMAFPSARMRAPEVEKIGGDRTGHKYKKFGIRWTYTMRSNVPLIAVPTLWR